MESETTGRTLASENAPSAQAYPAPVLPSYSTDDMQLAPGFPISHSIEQSLTRPGQLSVGTNLKTSEESREDGSSSVRSQSPLDAQWDRIDTPESSVVLLCPHITFHCTRPIDLKVRLTPTVTVIPPSDPLEHDRMFATSIGEHINLDMSIEGNGKITRILSRPEGTDKPEKISLLKKSQAKGAGGHWYVSRQETQEHGGWGSAEVGELGGIGNDGKKRNPGIMLDWSFKGEQNEKRSFAVAYDKLSEFLDLFMDTCGYPKRERQTMINFWARRLPQEASKDEFLLIKLLPVKDLISLLPIQTEPPPDRTVRFFVILRRATREIVKKENLRVRGEMASVVYEVLGSKPPPVVPATKGRKRGRGKAKQKGPYNDSNASMREAERPAGPDPNPRVPVEGGSGLTIFEYGGVLMANHAAEGSIPEKPTKSAATTGKSTPTHSAPASEASFSASVPQYEQEGEMDVDRYSVATSDSHHFSPPYSVIPDTQTDLQMSNFAAQPSEEVISQLYYDTNANTYFDPFNYFAHQDLELHDPNQHIFTVVNSQQNYDPAFFSPQNLQNMAPPEWGWPPNQ